MSASADEIRKQIIRQRIERARADKAAVNSAVAYGKSIRPPPAEGEIVTDDPSFAKNFGRKLAQEFTEVAGFPADIAIGAGLMAADTFLPESVVSSEEIEQLDQDVDASRAFQELLGKAGVRSDPVEPRTTPERLAHNVLTPLASGMGLLGAARKTTGRVGRALKDRFGDYAKSEAAAATAGGLGRTVFEEAGANEFASTGAELMFNIMGGSAVDRSMAIAREIKEGPQKVKDFAKKQVEEFSSQEMDVAASVIQNSVKESGFDPIAAAEEVRAGAQREGADLLTVGAASRNPALQSLENTVIKDHDAARLEFDKRQTSLTDYIHSGMREAIGDPSFPVEYLEIMRRSADYATNLVEETIIKRVNDAVLLARETPTMPGTEGELGETIKKILQEAEQAARAVEREKWQNLNLSDVSMRPLIEKFDEIMGEAKQIDKSRGLQDFPDAGTRAQIIDFVTPDADDADEIAQLLDAKGKPIKQAPKTPEIVPDATVPADEVIALRSVLLEEAAKASAENSPSKARRLYALAEAALDTLQTGSTDFVRDMNEARKYSFNLNERFTRDVIGPLLSATARRGQRVPGNEVMESLFKGGQAGATNIAALKLAAGEMPAAASAAIMRKFFHVFVEGGDFNTRAGEKFLEDYRPALREAGLEDMVEANVRASNAIDIANDDAALIAKGIKDSEVSRILREYGATGPDLENAIQAMFTKTGKSQQRLQEMFNRISSAQGLTPAEKRAANGALRTAIVEGALKSFFTDSDRLVADLKGKIVRVRSALEATGQYSKQQIDRVEQVANLLLDQKQAGARTAFAGQSNTASDVAQSKVLERLMRVAFLRKIAPIFTKGSGAASLSISQTVGEVGAELGRKVGVQDAQQLINMAIFDADLMEALLKRNADLTGRDRGIIAKALRAIARTSVGIVKRVAPRPFSASQVGIVSGATDQTDRAQEQE